MLPRYVNLSAFLLFLSVATAAPELLAKKKDKADAEPNEHKRAVHALNRLGFGARPGDVQQVMDMGADRWIDLQLHPEKISDNTVESRLQPLRTLRMSSREIMEDFPDNQMIKQVMDGKRAMPSDPARRAVYQVQIARLEQKLQEKQNQQAQRNTPAPSGPAADQGAKTEQELAAAGGASSDAAPAETATASGAMNGEGATTAMATPPAETKPTPEEEAEARRREDRLYADLEVQGLIDLPPDERYKKVMSMSVEEQVAFADSLRGGKGQEFLTGLDPKQRETLLAMNNPQQVVVEELSEAKLMRAI